jgi:hypothetical protein
MVGSSFRVVIQSCIAVITVRSRPTNPCAVCARHGSPLGFDCPSTVISGMSFRRSTMLE